MEFDIVKGVQDDVKTIMEMIANNIKDMESQEIFQWNQYYPTTEVFEGDIEEGSLYLIKSGEECIGTIVIDNRQSPEYEEIKWECSADKIMVIHRLAVNPKYQRKGVARALMDFAENFAVNEGYSSIRLDAYSGNPRTLKFYEARGYKNMGELFFPYRNLPFYCYEKIL